MSCSNSNPKCLNLVKRQIHALCQLIIVGFQTTFLHRKLYIILMLPKSTFSSISTCCAEGTKELSKEGCFMPKCKQRSWDIRFKYPMDNEHAGFWYTMPEHTKVIFRKEVRLYTVLNFFAEVGGYLGLLLGESLFSYIIAASKWILFFARKLKAKCNKVDSQQMEVK